MKNHFFRALTFVRHLLFAGNQHSIHSPFLYSLYCEVLKEKHQQESQLSKVNKVRERLSNQHVVLKDEDFGSHSVVLNNKKRRISSIYHTSSISPKIGNLLFRIVQRLGPKSTIELGTCFGIGTSYLALADKTNSVYTFEGNENRIRIAQKTFEQLGTKNVHIIKGNIDQTLPTFLSHTIKIDVAYLDANHTYDATIHYFHLLKKARHNDSCIIFDDIYLTKEMNNAWKAIISDSEVTLSIDLWYIGIVFFRREQRKEHFKLRI